METEIIYAVKIYNQTFCASFLAVTSLTLVREQMGEK